MSELDKVVFAVAHRAVVNMSSVEVSAETFLSESAGSVILQRISLLYFPAAVHLN